MKQPNISLIFISLFVLFSLSSFSQGDSKTKVAIGFSSKGEFFQINEYSNPISTPIGIFAQYRFAKRFSLYTSYYYSSRHFQFEKPNDPDTRHSFQSINLKEESFRFEHLLKFYFYRKKANYFVGLGTSFRDVFRIKKNKIREFQNFNSQYAIITTFHEQTLTNNKLTNLRGYNFVLGADYNFPKHLFLSWHLGVNKFGSDSYKNFSEAEFVSRSDFESEVNYFLKVNLGWYFTN